MYLIQLSVMYHWLYRCNSLVKHSLRNFLIFLTQLPRPTHWTEAAVTWRRVETKLFTLLKLPSVGRVYSCHVISHSKKKLGKRSVCFTRDRSKHLVYPWTTWTWLIDLMKLWRPHVDVSHHRRCLGILWESPNRSWSWKLKKDEFKNVLPNRAEGK